MTRLKNGLLRWLPLLAAAMAAGWPETAAAQGAPQGENGLRADYYNGANFEELVLSRRDATVAFDWAHRSPAPGVNAEYFSVRWTGWLVPPASGRYVFHATVDDGMRIWLNDRLILNEWRPQPVSRFATTVELKGGEPYRLRVEYFQAILDTRANLTWERAEEAAAQPPPSSWRNFWGMAADKPAPPPIPMRYLFTRNPRAETSPPIPPPVKAPAAPPKASAEAPVPPRTAPPVPPKKPRLAPAGPRRAARPSAAPALVVADSDSRAQLARLAVGEAVTLPELYFNQGQALLLPPVRAALDGLAGTLKAQPDWRFEVQGHTDNVGSAELNRQLSQQRAEAVCLYLAAHGVAAGQLRPVGYGGTQPVADNADPNQRPLNRRVVLRRL